jgi:glyoxalase family protein
MSLAPPGDALFRHHHSALCTVDAQQVSAFHTRALSLKCVKRTLRYDGKIPVYHLYYGNDMGKESSLVTSFPERHLDGEAGAGTGQIAYFTLSAPSSALDYRHARLRDAGLAVTATKGIGERCIDFAHPCRIWCAIAGVDTDARAPRSAGPVPREPMQRGTHSICGAVRDLKSMDACMQTD